LWRLPSGTLPTGFSEKNRNDQIISSQKPIKSNNFGKNQVVQFIKGIYAEYFGKGILCPQKKPVPMKPAKMISIANF